MTVIQAGVALNAVIFQSCCSDRGAFSSEDALKGRRGPPGPAAHRGSRAQRATGNHLDLPVRRGRRALKATRVRPRWQVCIRSGGTRALIILRFEVRPR